MADSRNITVEVKNTVRASTVNIEEKVTNVVVETEFKRIDVNVDVSPIERKATVIIQPFPIRAVTVNVEGRGGPDATDTIKGKMKLYESLGINEDGTLTQKAVKENLDLKIDKIEGYDLVSVSYLLHQARMDIRNFNFHMETALQNQ
jgi:hypothetical protein